MTSEQRQEVEARIKELEGKVKASPEDVASLRELSDLSALMGQYKKSRELAEQVTKADPKDSQAWLALVNPTNPFLPSITASSPLLCLGVLGAKKVRGDMRNGWKAELAVRRQSSTVF